jgi:hypothetical protein
MLSSRGSLVLFSAIAFAGFLVLRSVVSGLGHDQQNESWRNHPVLLEPDGYSHRGGKMVAPEIKDERILAELSRRYKATRPLRITNDGMTGAEDFERRQEYLLRLLDYYWFSEKRLVGMTRAEVERIFGPVETELDRAYVRGGRDALCLWFKEGRVTGAYYAMGY